jgi:hypothetical protein
MEKLFVVILEKRGILLNVGHCDLFHTFPLLYVSVYFVSGARPSTTAISSSLNPYNLANRP